MAKRNREASAELLRIGEVAERADVRADTIRYYERIGLIEPTARSAARYRLYDPEVIERLAFVKKAQALGLTLKEVGDVLRAALEGSAPCDHVLATLTTRLAEVDERIAELRGLRRSLVRALGRGRDLPVATGCLCGIIESTELPAGRSTS